MSSNKPTHSENPEALSSFEAKLRGNYKRMFAAESPARSTAETSVPPAQGGATGVLLGDIEDVTMTVQPDVEQEFNATQNPASLQQAARTEESVPKGTAEGDKEAIEGSESDGSTGGVHEYIEYDGDPPDLEGWHKFPSLPRGRHAIVILHNGDGEWLGEHKDGFPLGVRGPEGYIWAMAPEDLLWAECCPNYMTRISISQLRSLDQGPFFQVFKSGEEDLEGAKPIAEGHCGSQQALELVCGKPTIVPSIPYATTLYFKFLELTGIDHLNVYIPLDELPLTLDVFDEDDVTNPDTHDYDAPTGATFDRTVKVGIPIIPVSPDTKPIKYRLVDPTGKRAMKRMPGQATHATLVISKSRQIGTGNSARVYEGQIGLNLEDGPVHQGQERHTKFPPKLRVVTKVGAGSAGTGYMKNEAKMYNSFPDHFFHEYTGFQLVKPSHFPRRLSQLVPFFYGYYEPVQVEIEGGQRRMPIMLMEDCGVPIDAGLLTQNQKAEIVSMFDRMHHAGFVHRSVAPRNILIQPGSTVLRETFTNTPQWARALRTPSFRIIDFGRSEKLIETDDISRREMIRREMSQLEQAVQMRLVFR